MTQKSIGPHFISAYVAHLMTSENNTLFAQDNVRKREHLMQQQIYNRCHITTAPNTTGKSSMTSIAHRGGWGPTRMPNAHKTTQSRLPEKSTVVARQMHSQKYQVTRKEPLQRQPHWAPRQAQGVMGNIGIGLVHVRYYSHHFPVLKSLSSSQSQEQPKGVQGNAIRQPPSSGCFPCTSRGYNPFHMNTGICSIRLAFTISLS